MRSESKKKKKNVVVGGEFFFFFKSKVISDPDGERIIKEKQE